MRWPHALLVLWLALLSLPAGAAPVSGVQFDDYRIGFEALLANGEVEEAYQLAREVTRQYPRDRDWQRRLARVAVWTNRPAEAYAAWKGLFDAGVRDAEVQGEVRRLATHYNDAPVLIDLWHASAPARAMTDKEAETLAGLYERAYRPLDGARHFEQLYRRQGHARLGLQAARLYDRAGHDADAVRLYRTLLDKEPGNVNWLLTAARLEIRRDRRRAALELLKQHQRHVNDGAFEYWQMLGDLAWLYQDDATATAAYRRAAVTPAATLVERDRLTYLLMQEDPLEAAALSLRYHSEGAGTSWLLRALEIQVGHNAWPQARETLGRAQGEDLRTLQQNPRFLTLRAHVHQHFGATRKAVADIRQALAVAPEEDDVRLSALWLFIAAGEHDALRAMVVAAGDTDSADPRYWQALGAAYQALGQPRLALAYYRMQLQMKPDDPLLLLGYADLLADSGQTETVLWLRQRAWRVLQAQSGDDDAYRARARAGLGLAERPGDLAALRARRLVAQSHNPAPARQLDEVLLTWALANGQWESAQAWSRQRYGRGQTLPVWVQLQLALESRDHAAVQRLLETEGESLAPAAAHEAALLLGDWPLGRHLAFEGAQRAPDSDDLHQRLVETMVRHGSYAEVNWQSAEYSDVDVTRYGVRAGTAVSSRWRLGGEIYRTDQSLVADSTLDIVPASVPAHETGGTLEARWESDRQRWRLALDRRREYSDYAGVQLEYRRQLSDRLQLDLLAADDQPTEHSTALQLAGHADRAVIGASWAFDRQLLFSAQAARERYHTQIGAYLGSGTQGTWEVAYRLRSGYPDWNVRAYGSYYRFEADGMPDGDSLRLFSAETLAETLPSNLDRLFIPDGNNYHALCGGVGQYLRDSYSRRIRPLADVCAIHRREGDAGYSAALGLAGAVAGQDHLLLLWERSREGRLAGGRDLRVLTLNYRRYF